MLTHTFCHLPGIGLSKERALWTQGILTWEDFLQSKPRGISDKRYQVLAQELTSSAEHRVAQDAAFFAQALPKSEQWRLFATFRDSLGYVDIETTGGMNGLDHITTVAVFDRREVHTFVHGTNLEETADLLAQTQVVITYNGACFDLPYLHRELDIPAPPAHIDLRFLLAGLGLKGGLKGCERQLGLSRGELDGFDGYLAVLLWHGYQRSGDERYIETLLRYNSEDVINLDVLMSEAWNRKVKQLPFPSQHMLLQPPQPFPNPYPLHPEILHKVRPYLG